MEFYFVEEKEVKRMKRLTVCLFLVALLCIGFIGCKEQGPTPQAETADVTAPAATEHVTPPVGTEEAATPAEETIHAEETAPVTTK